MQRTPLLSAMAGQAPNLLLQAVRSLLLLCRTVFQTVKYFFVQALSLRSSVLSSRSPLRLRKYRKQQQVRSVRLRQLLLHKHLYLCLSLTESAGLKMLSTTVRPSVLSSQSPLRLKQQQQVRFLDCSSFYFTEISTCACH